MVGNLIHEVFKFGLKNTLIEISTLNHILNEQNHVCHPQGHYKQWTIVLFSWQQILKEKNGVFGFQNQIKLSVHCKLMDRV